MLAATHTIKSRVEMLKMRFVLNLRLSRCLSLGQPGTWRKVARVFSIVQIEIVMCGSPGPNWSRHLELSFGSMVWRDAVNSP